MRIFLSYPAEQHQLAERIALALRGEGHRVFFDRSDLHPGARFDEPIRDAIAASDLMIFLITPESVQEGSYTRTELRLAQERWPHPSERLLPVQVAPTDIERVPAYLRAVSIYVPAGDTVAEIASLVHGIRRRRRNPLHRPGARAAAVALFALGTVGVGVALIRGSQRDLELSGLSLARVAVGVASVPDRYELSGWVRNQADRRLALDALTVEVSDDSVRALRVEPPSTERVPPLVIEPGARRPVHVFASFVGLADSLPVPADRLRTTRWRACWTREATQECGAWNAWPELPAPATTARLDASIRARARHVVSDGRQYFVALADPDQLVRLGPDGALLGPPLPLAGEPSALAVNQGALAVGTRAPGVVQIFDTGSLRSSVRRVPGGEVLGSRTSTSVQSLAVTRDGVWVITGGESDGAASIRYLARADSAWVNLPYADDVFAFDPRGIRLQTGPDDEVWGVTAETTPSSVYRLTRARVREYRGHTEQHISCARDLGVLPSGLLVVPGCEEGLLAVRPTSDGLPIEERFPGEVVPVQADWDEQWITAGREAILVGVTALRNDPESRDFVPIRSRITLVPTGEARPRVLFDLPNVALEALALQGQGAMAVVRDRAGAYDLIPISLRR